MLFATVSIDLDGQFYVHRHSFIHQSPNLYSVSYKFSFRSLKRDLLSNAQHTINC